MNTIDERKPFACRQQCSCIGGTASQVHCYKQAACFCVASFLSRNTAAVYQCKPAGTSAPSAPGMHLMSAVKSGKRCWHARRRHDVACWMAQRWSMHDAAWLCEECQPGKEMKDMMRCSNRALCFVRALCQCLALCMCSQGWVTENGSWDKTVGPDFKAAVEGLKAKVSGCVCKGNRVSPGRATARQRCLPWAKRCQARWVGVGKDYVAQPGP